MARYDPPDYGDGGKPSSQEPEPAAPIPSWRTPIALVGWGLLIAILLGLIIWGIFQIARGGTSQQPATTTNTTTTTTTTIITTTTTSTTTATTDTSTPVTSTADTLIPPASTTSSAREFPQLPSVIPLPPLPGLPTAITLPPGL